MSEQAQFPTSRRVIDFLIGDVEALTVRIFEVCFTCAYLVWVGHGLWNWREWLTAEGFHFNAHEVKALAYPPPMPLLTGVGVLVFALLLLASSVSLALNFGRRVALAVLFASALYIQGVDGASAAMANKLFIGTYFCLLISPGCFRCATTGKLMISAVALRATQGTLLLMYFSSGFAKAFLGDWLKYDDVVYTHVQGVYRTGFAAWMLRTMPVWTWTVMQWVTLLFEIEAPVLFTVHRLRPAAITVGFGFHLMIALMMKDLILYALPMWSFYTLFITAEEWCKVVGRIKQCCASLCSRMKGFMKESVGDS